MLLTRPDEVFKLIKIEWDLTQRIELVHLFTTIDLQELKIIARAIFQVFMKIMC